MTSQLIFNGLMLGAVFSLVALGLVLIFSVMNVVNFAHGEFYTMGGFMAFFIFQNLFVKTLGWPHLFSYFIVLLMTMVLIGTVGFVIEKAIMSSFRDDLLMGMMATIALSIIFSMGMASIFGAGTVQVFHPVPGVMSVLGARVSRGRMFIMIMAVFMCGVLTLFIHKSRLGKAMRACMLNPEVAQLQGINYNFISALGFGIGCALAAVAGLLVVPSCSLNPFVGGGYLMKSFIIVIIGGLGSLPGTIVAGFILGFFESFGSFYFGQPVVILLSFVLIIVMLIVRPQGLMGRAE